MSTILKKLTMAVRDPVLVCDYFQSHFCSKQQSSPSFDPSQYKSGIKVEIEPLQISGNIMTFSWNSNGRIPGILKNKWTLEYPPYIDLTSIPRELLWMMYAMMTSEFFAWTSKIVIALPEKFDERFLIWWKGVLEINHRANPYNRNLADDSDFIFYNGKQQYDNSPNKWQDQIQIACMNGLGKDALAQIGLVKELSQEPILAVTVEHPWLFNKFNVYSKLRENCMRLEQHDIRPVFVSSQIKESFDFKIIPWYIFSLPLLYVHNVSICYHAEELDFHKYLNGVPIKPNTTIILLESINRILGYLDYDIKFKSGIVPLSSFGTQKLLIERYPQLQRFQASCMRQYPACSRCRKCQSHMAYISLCGKDYRDFGYHNVDIVSALTINPTELLDLERESQHHAFNKISGVTDSLDWVEKYYEDALPYAVLGAERILKQHFDSFTGPFNSYGIFEYDAYWWSKFADAICNGSGFVE